MQRKKKLHKRSSQKKNIQAPAERTIDPNENFCSIFKKEELWSINQVFQLFVQKKKVFKFEYNQKYSKVKKKTSCDCAF